MAESGFAGEMLSPAQVADKTLHAGVVKANAPVHRTFLLAMMAGFFVALATLFFLSATTDLRVGYGLQQLLGGISFCVGLVLILLCGAELFTGNSLLIVAFASGKITLGQMLRNWLVVWLGNFAGSLIVMGLGFWAQHWAAANYLVGVRALTIGATKMTLPFGATMARALLCNLIVCLAVWAATSGRTATDKIVTILLPITAFSALGLEHCVANMSYVPYALWLKGQPAVVAAANLSADALANLTWGNFLLRLVPVTLGNILGGAVMVGLVYWFIYVRDTAAQAQVSRKVV